MMDFCSLLLLSSSLIQLQWSTRPSWSSCLRIFHSAERVKILKRTLWRRFLAFPPPVSNVTAFDGRAIRCEGFLSELGPNQSNGVEESELVQEIANIRGLTAHLT